MSIVVCRLGIGKVELGFVRFEPGLPIFLRPKSGLRPVIDLFFRPESGLLKA